MKVLVASGSPLLRAVLEAAVAGTAGVDTGEPVGTVTELHSIVTAEPMHVVVATPQLADGPLSGVIFEVLRTGARVLVVCDTAETEQAAGLLFSGASGCLLLQDSAAEDVAAAVQDVAADRASLHPIVAATVLAQWRGTRGHAEPAPDELGPPVELTLRESEVLNGLAQGFPTKSIARDLGVSPKTVESHIGRLLIKLNARNRAQALAVAFESGLLTLEDRDLRSKVGPR